MKKFSALALIALLSVGGTCVRAQGSLALDEPSENQFEFLRNLRQKGYAAQANEYIEILLKSADKSTTPLLNLEKARNSVALAKEGKSLEEKTKLLSEAKALFEPFIKGGAKTAPAAQARTELAKLLSIQAQMTLNKALAADNPAAKEAGAKAARGLYDAADSEFKQSVAVLKELAKSSKQYEAELVQSEFDQANNLIDKAQAFVDLNDSAQNRTRAETVAAAAKIFLPIAAKKDTAQGLLANAYLVKVSQENQDPTKVIDYVNIVNKATEKFAEPAQRLAAYYDLSWMPQNPNARQLYKENLYKKQVEFCGDWLKAYPAYRRSYNGEAVRFEQAQACLKVAAQMSDGLKPEKIAKLDRKTRAEFDGYFNNAKKLSEELDKEKGDFAERGASFHSYIVELELKNGLSVVNNSGTMVLRASLEFQSAVKAASEPERQKHLRKGLSMLETAIARGYDEKLPASKLHEYEFIQGSVYFGINDFHRAAVSFEALARELPPSKKGAEAAEQAIQIYKTLADKESDKSARERLHDLADYVFKQKSWEAEPVHGFARYDLAMDYQSDENTAEALKQFALLPKEFPGYTYAQGQALFIALSARKADETPEGKKTWTNAAKKAIDRMGQLPADANPTTSLMWFYAASEGPKFHYADAAAALKDEKLNEAEKDYLAMKKNTLDIAAVFKKYGDKLDPKKKEGVKFTIEVLDKYWRLGLADVAYRQAKYADVISNDLLGATLGKLV
ncbi:MAG TPA: hypothetical protein VHR72_14880, partial [Gemmataceae bacterium]|nr:hypothetical protein [Gemmataceae bacterium]